MKRLIAPRKLKGLRHLFEGLQFHRQEAGGGQTELMVRLINCKNPLYTR